MVTLADGLVLIRYAWASAEAGAASATTVAASATAPVLRSLTRVPACLFRRRRGAQDQRSGEPQSQARARRSQASTSLPRRTKRRPPPGGRECRTPQTAGSI